MKTCTWTCNLDAFWDTECGEAFWFSTDGPTDNQFRYCPYCGGELVQAALVQAKTWLEDADV